MSVSVLLTGFLCGMSLIAGVYLLSRNLWNKRLHERVIELRASGGRRDEANAPATIRLAPQDGERLTGRLAILLAFDPGNPGQNLIPWKLTLGLACLVGALGAWVASGIIGITGVMLAFPSSTILFARFVFMWQRRRYQRKLLVQIPEVMDFISRGIRAGIPLTEAIRSVSQEIASPSREVFQQAIADIAIGRSLAESLSRSAAQTGLREYSFLAVAVSLQANVGGSLYETLDNLSDIVRKRIAVAERGRALAAEARASAMILSVLPFVAAIMMSIVRPGYLDVFFDDRGHGMLLMAGALLATGTLVMREMMRRSLAL